MRDVIVSVRFTTEELERIRSDAKRYGRSLSEHMRHCVSLLTGRGATVVYPPYDWPTNEQWKAWPRQKRLERALELVEESRQRRSPDAAPGFTLAQKQAQALAEEAMRPTNEGSQR
jgi:hypothetical protein